MTFDFSRFTTKLQNASLPPALSSVSLPVVNLQVYETVNSTNRVLWDWIAQGQGEGSAVLALRQNAGHGQWGRAWQSEPGGLYLSVALEPRCAIANAGQIMLCTTWGIASVLRHHGVPVQIKWFNDLVVGRQKLGGILIETRMAQERVSQAVVGVGINWNNPVPETGITLKSIISDQETLGIQTLEDVAAIALNGIRAGYRYWQLNGIEPILPLYQGLLARLGTPVQVNESWGRVVGVAANGNLRVEPLDSQGLPAAELQVQPGEIRLGYH